MNKESIKMLTKIKFLRSFEIQTIARENEVPTF